MIPPSVAHRVDLNDWQDQMNTDIGSMDGCPLFSQNSHTPLSSYTHTNTQLQWFVMARCGKVGAPTSGWINTNAQSITGDPETADSFISCYG